MKYHKYRFGIWKNIKVWFCRTFGHQLNESPKNHWCERCGLAYEECYYPKDWWVESGIVQVSKEEWPEYISNWIRKEAQDEEIT